MDNYKPYVIIYGVKWYYLLRPSKKRPGAALMDHYAISEMDRHLVICYSPNKLPGCEELYRTKKGDFKRIFAFFDSYVSFSRYLQNFDSENRNFYEVILGELPQKPHFDIDISKIDEDLDDVANLLYQAVIKGCIEVLNEINIRIDLKRDLLLYSSHGKSKRSFHLVINNKCHNNNKEAEAFYYAVMLKVSKYTNGKYLQFVDKSVYNPSQQFRIFGNQKACENRPKIFHDSYFYDGIEYNHEYNEVIENKTILGMTALYESLITFCSGCEFIPSLVKYENKIKNLPKQQDIGDDIVDKCINMLGKKMDSSCFEINTTSGNCIYLKRISPSFCPSCNRIHENENPYIFIDGGKLLWDCRRSLGKTFVLGYFDTNEYIPPDQVESEDSEEDEKELFIGGISMGFPTIKNNNDRKIAKPSGLSRQIYIPPPKSKNVEQKSTINTNPKDNISSVVTPQSNRIIPRPANSKIIPPPKNKSDTKFSFPQVKPVELSDIPKENIVNNVINVVDFTRIPKKNEPRGYTIEQLDLRYKKCKEFSSIILGESKNFTFKRT